MRIIPISAAIMAAITVAPTGLDSCAIGPPEPLLVARRGPAEPRETFAKGRIGVVRDTYNQRSLIAAYRALSGAPLTREELAAYFPTSSDDTADPGAWRVAQYAGTSFGSSPSYSWTQAAQKVQGVQFSYIGTYKTVSKAGLVYSYRNCLDDSFASATQTLRERAAKWGWESETLREWAQAQQNVFTHCSGEQAVMPADPRPDMDPLLAADRRYQIAAAHFYEEEWQKAREGFEAIARDDKSPWHGIAPYLIARCYLREGSLGGNIDALREAEKRLKAILNDPSRKQWHDASKALLDLVQLRIDPYTRLAKLSATLMKPSAEDDIEQTLTDFTYLLDKITDQSKITAASDMAGWLVAIGRGPDEKFVLERWNATHSAAWLIAALPRVQNDAALAELLQAARAVKPSAPEYESATYYAIELAAERGRADEARAWADDALRRPLLVSTRNLILAQRLQLARTWTEFLRYAPRRPEPKLATFDNYEIPVETPPTSSGTAPLFDSDVTDFVNHRAPLALWLDACRNPLVPLHLQLQIAEAGWLRAALLERHADARQFLKRIVQIQPGFGPALRDVLAESGDEEAARASLMLMLRMPALHPFLLPAYGDFIDLSLAGRSGAGRWGFTKMMSPPFSAKILSASQQQQNDSEHAQLEKLAPAGATYLAEQSVKWANAKPDDPRVPEALHLAVQATRRGMKDERTGQFSQQAFALLHQRYSQSEWAQKTKYWYK